MRGLCAIVGIAAVAVVGCTTAQVDPPDEPPDPPEQAAPEEEPEDERAGGTLRIGLAIDPISIDPRFVVDDEGELVVDALFDPLVRVDQQLRVVPAAATRWDIDDDGRVFTFHLREAAFHDGTPVTAADFKRTFDHIADGTADPPSFLAYLLAPVEGAARAQEEGGGLEGVEVIDDDTLVIRLSAPQPGFVTTLADPSLVPLPPAAADDPEDYAIQPIGNGPFAMAEPREPDAFLRLTGFADHHRPPLLDEVLFLIYPDDPARDQQWEDLVNGALQVAEVSADRVDEAIELYGRSSDGYRGSGLLNGITSTVYLYGFDTSREPFDDARVRRAISMAIDRRALANDVMQGVRVAANAIIPPPFPGSQRGACNHCRHDPEAAAELFAEAREDTEVELDTITLAHNRGRTHAAIAERMAEDIEAALDIEVELDAHDLQPFVQAVRRGDLPLFRLGWDAGEPDPGAFLYPLFHSTQIGLDNLTRYDDEEVDALLNAARQAEDQGEALSHYRAAERRILDEAPALPLMWYRHSIVVSSEVQDLYWSPLGRIDLPAVWLDSQP